MTDNFADMPTEQFCNLDLDRTTVVTEGCDAPLPLRAVLNLNELSADEIWLCTGCLVNIGSFAIDTGNGTQAEFKAVKLKYLA